MVGMARCAVPARVVAGGTNMQATLAIERVAPLHAARTSQRDVPTALNRYEALGYCRSVPLGRTGNINAPLASLQGGYSFVTHPLARILTLGSQSFSHE